MTRRKAILQGSFWAVAQTVLRVSIGLVSVPLTLGYLGAERYGLWMTALSLNAFLTFLDAGLVPTLMNRMAEAHAHGDREAFRKLASAGIAVGAALFGLGAVLAGVALLLPWRALLHIHDPLAVREAPALVAVLVLSYSAGAALAGVEGILAARLQVVRPRVYGFAAALLSFGLLLAGIRLRAGLPVLALLTATTTVLYRLPLLAGLLLREPLLLRPRWFELKAILRALLPVGGLYVGIQVSAVVTSSLPNLLLAREVSLAGVASFSVAMRVVGIPLSVVSAMVPVVWPAFTLAWARGERSWLRRRLWLVTQATVLLLGLFTVAIAFAGPPLIQWWTHGKAQASPPLLIALGAWMVLQALVHWLSTFLHSITDFRFEIFCFAGAALLTLGLALPLTHARGPVGLAVAMALALLLGSVAPMALRVRRKLSVS